ncbi:MAG TPA: tetratricopeptide repeat protein [Vicinamibacterales bacterium]
MLRLSHPARLFVVIALAVCCASTGSSVRGAQGTPAPTDFRSAAAAAIAHGKRADAERMANAKGASDPAAAVVLAQLAVHRGRYKDALALLEPVVARDPAGDAALELATIEREVGRQADASTLFAAVLRQSSGASDAATLVRGGRAAAALNRPRDANTLFREADRAGGGAVLVQQAWGELFLEKHQVAEALKSFQSVLAADPEWAPAHAGLARVLEDEDSTKAAAAADRAVAIDPEMADARLVLASLHLDADQEADARAEIDKVLAVNPGHPHAHALRAAIAYVKDDTGTFEREMAAALATDPVYGEGYRLAGELAAAHYRFEEAVALAQKAVALDPSNSRAAADLGMHLLRTGDEAAARQTLERSFRADPFDVVTFNLLQMLDKLDKFAVERDGDMVFKMAPSEAPVLREYAVPLAKDAIATLSARYGFTPTGPIFIEIFPDHDDFAVRNLGLPGMIGALGACFGHVVTMDSPNARSRPGEFSWEATLWHELAHVITIQMSKQRIPRWLTEGISVYEEGRQRPEWGRDMEVTFARAMDKGKVLKLRELNAGFTRPETISLAYYEASLLVDHIVSTRGQPALNTLVRAFGDGVDSDAALKRAINVDFDGLQASFSTYLEDRFGSMRRALHDADTPVDARSLDALKASAAAKPESYIAQLALGEALAKAGDASAFAPLQRASALVPNAIGDESPHAIMAALAEKLNDRPRAMKEYEALIASDHTNVEAARKLWTLAEAAADDRLMTLSVTRIVSLDPFDATAHTSWGRMALKKRNPAVATREFRAALLTGAPDKAAAHCDLGESYLLAGDRAAAKQEALAALEIAPSFERAQELLLTAVGGHPSH